MTQKFTHETLLLHSTASNTKYEIDVWRYNHPDATKTVYLQGGIHGIELTGIPVVHEFIKEIEENQLAYNFICVPLSNPMGLDSQIMGVQTGYNNIHTNQQNCWNWNRITNLKDEPSQEGNWIKTLLDLAKPADIVSSGDYVTLDQDNQAGVVSSSSCSGTSHGECGPETVTISMVRSSGSYRFHVHNITDLSSTSSTALADNGTFVQVFYDDVSYNFDVPKRAGNLWTVFDFDNSTGFTQINTMSNESTVKSIDDH